MSKKNKLFVEMSLNRATPWPWGDSESGEREVFLTFEIITATEQGVCTGRTPRLRTEALQIALCGEQERREVLHLFICLSQP